MGAVPGNPTGVRSIGTNYATMARAADNDGTALRSAAASIPTASFTGPAGERMRAYVGNLEKASNTMADAYNRIAAQAPKLATAIEDSQKAHDKLETATKAVVEQQAEVEFAQRELNAAKAAVTIAKTTAPVQQVFGASAGPTPDQLAAVDAAKTRLIKAQHDLTDAKTDETKAKKAFTTAEDERNRMTRSFSALCRDQAAIARQAMPEEPKGPGVETITALVGGLASIASVGLSQAAAIAKYGVLTNPALPSAKAFYDGVATWTKRLEKFDNGALIVVPGVTSILEAFSNPNLTNQQRQDHIVNHVSLEAGLGRFGMYLGGALCAEGGPAAPVCATGGGIIFGAIGQGLEKVKPIRDGTDYVSHRVINPFTKGLGEFTTAGSKEDETIAIIDTLAAPGDAVDNVLGDLTNKVGLGGAVHDTGHYLNKRVLGPTGKGLSEIGNAEDAGDVGRGVIDTVASPVDAVVNVGSDIWNGL